MRHEISINEDCKMVMTKDEYAYSEVLETLDHAEFVRVVTYNITHESSVLLDKIEEFKDDKDVIIVTNIPGRFKNYTNLYARNRAKKTIDKYIDQLDPERFDAQIRTFFNFSNHSKIIMTDKVAYIGSANFSDASQNNNECGVVIKDSSIIQQIDDIFIKMQIEQSEPYYTKEYIKIFTTIASILTKLEMFYEEYYWSFYEDLGHPHHNLGDGYRGFNADLSPILVENIETLTYELEEAIKNYNDEGIFPSIFSGLDTSICESIREWFEYDSELEKFSRFDVDNKTQELFQQYNELGDPELLNEYAQMAADKATEINIELAEKIYNTAKNGLEMLKKFIQFLIELMAKVESTKSINNAVDNT